MVFTLVLTSLGLWPLRVTQAGPAQADRGTEGARAAQQALERPITEWAARNGIGLSLTVAADPSGATILEHDGRTVRNPASVSKLITALVALRTLGPSYRFLTRVHGRIINAKAERLILRGEGDPTLSSEEILGMGAQLSAMGLKRVDGPIVVDQSHFDDQFVPPSFDQQPNEWAAFRAPVCATAVDGNRLSLHVTPGAVGSAAHLYVEPLGAVELSGTIASVENPAVGHAHVQFSVVPATPRPRVKVGGEIDISESTLTLQRRVDDPRLIAGYVLREALRIRGIEVGETVVLGTVEDTPPLVTHTSDALSTILYRLGKDSNNFAAEMLLKSIGLRATGKGSAAAGVKVVLETLAALRADANVKWTNGSGLFDANRISTESLVRILVAARRDRRLAPEYLSQLAIGAADGTLASRLRRLEPGCLVRAKTGTLRDTVSLAGYVERQDERALAFAIVLENVKNQTAARTQIDRFVASLCQASL